jgi:filamentous hemagglutinin family protein
MRNGRQSDTSGGNPAGAGPVRTRRSRDLGAKTLLATAIISAFSDVDGQSGVLPQGGRVVAGSASIGAPQNGALTINQNSSRAVINWNSFSVGQPNSVNFVQPGASAAILNRVTGSTPSSIAGRINGNGQVFLVNPNGIAITPTGTVNVGGGFVGSTLDILDQDFMSGSLGFAGQGASAGVVNQGAINAAPGGFVALVGGTVASSGVIEVPMGRVALASGERATLDLNGNGFLQIAMPTDATTAGGQPLVDVGGRVSAAGGSIYIAAATAKQALRQAVNIEGDLSATSISGRNGDIVLDGGSGGDVSVGSGANITTASTDGTGGSIEITGHHLDIGAADIDASGATGGGTVLVGGGPQGTGTLAHADSTTIGQGARISADATDAGNGGQVVAWSDGTTAFAGTITARGGANGGDGGNVEVSGHTVEYAGTTITLAPAGKPGMLLLDPYNVSIQSGDSTTCVLIIFCSNPYSGSTSFTPTGNDTVFLNGDIEAALANSSVTIATGSGGTQNGDITVSAPLSWSNGTTLTMNAAGSIYVNSGITPGSGVTLNAGKDVALNANIGPNTFGSTSVSITAGTSGSGTLSVNSASITTGGGNLTAAATQTGATAAVTLSNATLSVGSGTGTISGTNTTTASGGVQISGTTSLSASGGGKLTISGTSNSGDGLTVGTGTVTTSGSTVLQGTSTSGAAIDIASGGRVQGASPVLVANGAFVNNQGSNAVTATSGRWLIYSSNPSQDVFNGLDSGNTAVWNTAYGGSISATGNRYVFSLQPTLTFTSTGTSKTYGANLTGTLGSDYTVSGLQTGVANAFLGDTASSVYSGTPNVTSSGASATASVAGGPYTMTLSQGTVTALTGYALSFQSSGTLTVNPAPITVTALGGSSSYGASPTNPGLSATGLQNGQSISVLTGLSNSFGIDSATDVGSYTLSVAGTLTNSNYTVSGTNTGTWICNPKALTINISNLSKTYGSTLNFAGTEFTASGLINGDSVTTVALSSTGAAPTATVAGGPYAITGSGAAGSGLGNYTISYVNGSLTVNPAPVTVTALGGSSTYGGSPANPGLSAAGLQNGEAVSVLTGLGNSFGINNNTNAGTYSLLVTGSNTNPNYTVTATNPGSWTVNPAPVTVTALGGSSTYGGSPADPGLSATGLQNGQSVGVLTGLNNSFGIDNNTNAGTYSLLVAGSNTNPNYTVTATNPGSWTVNPAPVTVTALGGSSTYGGSPADPGLSATGLQNGQTVSVLTGLNNSFGIDNTTGAGSYTLSVAGTLSNPNYTVAGTNTGTWIVNPKALTIDVSSLSKTYGSTLAFAGTEFTASGLVNGDSVSSIALSSAGAASTASVAGGPYPITGSGATGNGLGNYTISYVNGALTVTPAPVSVAALGGSSTYGSSPANPGLSATGLQNGETVGVLTGLSNSFGIDNNTNAGTYSLLVSGSNTNSNYTVTSTGSGTWTVNPAPVTVTALGGSSTYGSSPSDPGLSATGLQNGQTVGALTGLGNSFGIDNNTDAGSYTTSVTGAQSNPNYIVTATNSGTWVVNPAPVTVTVLGGSSTYGSSPTNPGLSVSGLQNGQTIAALTGLSNGFSVDHNTDAGTYALKLAGSLTNHNYTIATTQDGTWVVNPAPVTVTALGGSSTFGNSPANPGLSATGLQNGQTVAALSGLGNSFGVDRNTAAGTYTLKVAGALTNHNYTVAATQDGTWVVNPAPAVPQQPVPVTPDKPPVNAGLDGVSFAEDKTGEVNAAAVAQRRPGLMIRAANNAAAFSAAFNKATGEVVHIVRDAIVSPRVEETLSASKPGVEIKRDDGSPVTFLRMSAIKWQEAISGSHGHWTPTWPQATSIVLSVSAIVWATRIQSLLAALMATAPAWRALDPLPIMERRRRKKSDGTDEGPEDELQAAQEKRAAALFDSHPTDTRDDS